MELNIVNPDARYRQPSLETPPASGWLYLAAAVAPPSGPPVVRRNARRSALLSQLTERSADVRGLPGVEQVSVFRAVLMPPSGAAVTRRARFDVAVLIRTTSPAVIAELRATEPLTRMLDAMRAAAGEVNVMPARCIRYLGPVDPARRGLFLFNHFAAAAGDGPRLDLAAATDLWERLAGWYVAETGLTNSTLLGPTDASDFLFVNHARWDVGLARFMARQFSKSSFRTFVRANLSAHRIVAMPVLYRLA